MGNATAIKMTPDGTEQPLTWTTFAMFRDCWAKPLLATAVLLPLVVTTATTSEQLQASEPSPLILAHYMPWFVAKPHSQVWGWHWTMDHFDPEKIEDGKREIASHFYPLIGPYDSGDSHVLEYHLLTMKVAGIDGVIVDWYGLTDYRDYAILHHNTTQVLQQCERLGMKFVICYEDQTIPALVEARRITSAERVAHAVKEINWLGKYWFKSPSYVLLDEKPMLLSFGQTGLTDEEWSQCLMRTEAKVAYFSQHHRRTAAVGAFDWPVPSEALKAFERFHHDARGWPRAIPVAFPRFVDIYAEANVSQSYGRLDDDGGASFRKMLELALSSKAPVVQIATWNDWGEGTIIEPSREFGCRDLEFIQRLRRRQIDPQFAATPDDLRLPLQLLKRRRAPAAQGRTEQCERIANLISAGAFSQARSELTAGQGCNPVPRKPPIEPEQRKPDVGVYPSVFLGRTKL